MALLNIPLAKHPEKPHNQNVLMAGSHPNNNHKV
jgi:hypothetical protein